MVSRYCAAVSLTSRASPAPRRNRNQYRVSYRRPPALAKNGFRCRHRNCAERQPHHPPPTGRKDLGLAGANASRRNAQGQCGSFDCHNEKRSTSRNASEGRSGSSVSRKNKIINRRKEPVKGVPGSFFYWFFYYMCKEFNKNGLQNLTFYSNMG